MGGTAKEAWDKVLLTGAPAYWSGTSGLGASLNRSWSTSRLASFDPFSVAPGFKIESIEHDDSPPADAPDIARAALTNLNLEPAAVADAGPMAEVASGSEAPVPGSPAGEPPAAVADAGGPAARPPRCTHCTRWRAYNQGYEVCNRMPDWPCDFCLSRGFGGCHLPWEGGGRAGGLRERRRRRRRRRGKS